MKKGKITFAALIIALMLITIDVFFFILARPAFIGLTGALAAYGYIRGAMDFRNWLAGGDEPITPIQLDKATIEDETVVDTPRYANNGYFGSEDASNEAYVDAIIFEVSGND